MLTTLSSVHTNDCKDCPCKYVSISDSFFTLAGSNKYQEIKNRIDANPSLVNKLDDYGYSALHYAARENHVSVVRLLLSKGGSPDNNSCGYHIFTYLFIFSSLTSLFILNIGATPLLRAAYAGSYESCEALLKAGANVNSIDLSFHDGRTPLHKASSNGHDDVMVYLFQLLHYSLTYLKLIRSYYYSMVLTQP